MTILPGATLGMLGGGQLGAMFASAARRMGYEVVVLEPDPDCPAGRLAARHLRAPYDDAAALEELARTCAAVSVEFENVPSGALEFLERRLPVRPGSKAVLTAQDRLLEKAFLREAGLATAPWAPVASGADLDAGLRATGTPALLKLARLGYDGKGQAEVRTPEEARSAWEFFGRKPCVLEAEVPLDLEVSVVLARGQNGACAVFPVAENRHRDGILDVTVVPAAVPELLARQAESAALAVAERLDYVGVLAVEFFVSKGKLLVNEIAPRPHNSGHYTLDATATSQFEQQVRALCGLPLGDPRLLSPAVMANLLGDLWPAGGSPDWESVLREPQAKLHLYGKRAARPGRKMGHFTILAPARDRALEEALRIQAALREAAPIQAKL